MENKEFCHLHLHSTFSKLDGFGYPKEYANKAKKMGFEYLACTDHGNIDGLIKFQTGCKEEDIKPIFGCEAYMVENYESKEKPGHVSIWVKNEIGFKNLCRILSIANLVGFNKKPRISFQDFYDHVDGLVVGTACVQSFVNLKNGKAFFRKLKKRLGSDLYVEIMPNDMSLQKDHNQAMVKLSHRTKTKIIATNDCHYIKRSDNKLQEMLLAIQSKKTWNDPKRWKFSITGLYLKSAKEMKASLNQIGFYKKEYLSNTIEIAKKCCGFSIPKREIDLPRVPGVPINPIEAKRMLLSLCKKGFEKKFGHKIEKNKIYHERLKEEHDLIARKNFERYFFIVWELCEWCKKQEILIGPGRGSVGGSLIAYLLGITSVDPIKHNLFFSRFISEDRIDYPDIDLDFEDRKRHLIKQHLESVYGEGHVAGVSSFSRLQARAAIQDVARVFEVPPGEVNHFTKLIDETSNDPVSEKIETATQFPDGQLFANKYPKVIRIAKKIGGQIRGYSQHAAALVISKDDISEGGRCNLIERNEARLINWEKDDAEYMGLMKLDALGLKLLSILSHCLKLIKDNHQKAISLEKINLEDKEVLSQIGQGNNVGVFQLNTWAMSSLAKDIGIKSFNEIVDTIALVRPGPMASGMTKEYIKRKNGLSWERMHPIYEELTKDTFGLLVYQEQVMNVISKVAGLPYSTADKIRKIIGKKRDKKEFEKYEKIFKSGCKKKKTLSPQEADDFWTGLQEWVRYGFNLCLSGDTLLERSSFNQYAGKYISISELYEKWSENSPVGHKYRQQGLQVIQLCEDNRCRPGRVVGVYYNGRKKVYEIKTQSGKEVKGTLNHRLLTYNGYEEIQNLSIGDRLAVVSGFQRSITERLGQRWKKTNNKKRGFQKGKDNPAYLDGRTKKLKRSRIIVRNRSKGFCENCKEKPNIRFEFAHIKPLSECGNNYLVYHDKNNIKYLCGSCHRRFDYEKGERKRRYENGYPIFYDSIVSIKYAGKEDVFDIEMEGPFHNFSANGIISHNSHSVEYAILGYWCAWLKHYFPSEFICASLTFGDETKKPELVEEAYKLGLSIILPKVGKSDAFEWMAKNSCLHIPFAEVKTIGKVKATQAAESFKTKSKADSFFKSSKTEQPQQIKGKFGELLNKIGAYQEANPELTEEIKNLFKFRIVTSPRTEYQRLYSLFGDISLKDLDPLLSGSSQHIKKLQVKPKRLSFSGNRDLINCELCELVKECQAPVLPSKGKLNIAIVGEAPGPQEDEQKEGFVGKSGEKIWKQLKKWGYERELFHISNVAKCYPSKSRKPNSKQIQLCGKTYLDKELREIKPIVILAFGNTSLEFFKDQKKGIMSMSGQVAWNEKYGAWIVYCLHPAATLHNPDNEGYYLSGMRSFRKLLKSINLKKTS